MNTGIYQKIQKKSRQINAAGHRYMTFENELMLLSNARQNQSCMGKNL